MKIIKTIKTFLSEPRNALNIVSATLQLGGLILIIITLGWLPAIGVFLFIWGNNIMISLKK